MGLMKKIFILSLLLLVSGCYAKLTPVMRTPETVDSYHIGVIQTTSVGEPMVSRTIGHILQVTLQPKTFNPFLLRFGGS